MTDKQHKDTEKNWFWRTIDSIEGDKVVWIIVLLLSKFLKMNTWLMKNLHGALRMNQRLLPFYPIQTL